MIDRQPFCRPISRLLIFQEIHNRMHIRGRRTLPTRLPESAPWPVARPEGVSEISRLYDVSVAPE